MRSPSLPSRGASHAIRRGRSLARRALLVSWFVAAVPPLAAQRQPIGGFANYADNGVSGQVWTGSDTPRVLEWSIDSGPRFGLIATHELSFDVPGDPCDVGGARILVPGLDRATGKGWLEIVHLYADTSTIETEQRVECGAGVDPAQVYFDRIDGFLYVYDFADHRLLAAPFDGSRLPSADEFSVAATSSEVGALSEHYLVKLSEPFEASRGVGVQVPDCTGPLPFWNVQRTEARTFRVTLVNSMNQPRTEPWRYVRMSGDRFASARVDGTELIWSRHSPPAAARLQLPLQSVECVGKVAGDIVVAGEDARGRASLVRIAVDDTGEGALRVTHQQVYDGICFGAVCGDSVNHEMFLFTEPDGRILCAKDEGLPTDGAWELAATIEHAWWMPESNMAGGVDVLCEVPYRRVARNADRSWSVTLRESSVWKPPIRASLAPLSLAGPIEAYVDEPGDLALEDTAGTVVSLGYGASGTYRLPSGTTLDPARAYRLQWWRGDKVVTSDWSVPHIAVHQPGASAEDASDVARTAASFAPIDLPECYVGTSSFLAKATVAETVRPGGVVLYAWSHIVPPNTPAPIVTRSDSVILAAAAGTKLTSFAANGQKSVLTVPFQVPADASLAGSFLYLQACAVETDSGTAALSDVFGVAIRSGPPGPAHADPERVAAYLAERSAPADEIAARLTPFEVR